MGIEGGDTAGDDEFKGIDFGGLEQLLQTAENGFYYRSGLEVGSELATEEGRTPADLGQLLPAIEPPDSETIERMRELFTRHGIPDAEAASPELIAGVLGFMKGFRPESSDPDDRPDKGRE